jgi:hypothetical protein
VRWCVPWSDVAARVSSRRTNRRCEHSGRPPPILFHLVSRPGCSADLRVKSLHASMPPCTHFTGSGAKAVGDMSRAATSRVEVVVMAADSPSFIMKLFALARGRSRFCVRKRCCSLALGLTRK